MDGNPSKNKSELQQYIGYMKSADEAILHKEIYKRNQIIQQIRKFGYTSIVNYNNID